MGSCLCGFASVARGQTLLVEFRPVEPPWQGAVAATTVAERAPSTPRLADGPAQDPAMGQAAPDVVGVPPLLGQLPVKAPPAIIQRARAEGRNV